MALESKIEQERIPRSSESGRHLTLCKEPDDGSPTDTSELEGLVRYDWNDEEPAAKNYAAVGRLAGTEQRPLPAVRGTGAGFYSSCLTANTSRSGPARTSPQSSWTVSP